MAVRMTPQPMRPGRTLDRAPSTVSTHIGRNTLLATLVLLLMAPLATWGRVHVHTPNGDGPCDTNGTTNQPGIANNLLTSCESAPREGPVRLAAELGTPTAEAAGYDAFLDDDCISLLSLEFPCHSFGPGTTRLRMQSTGFDYSRPRVASFA